MIEGKFAGDCFRLAGDATKPVKPNYLQQSGCEDCVQTHNRAVRRPRYVSSRTV